MPADRRPCPQRRHYSFTEPTTEEETPYAIHTSNNPEYTQDIHCRDRGAGTAGLFRGVRECERTGG